MTMSRTTQERIKNAIAHGEAFHNSTRLTGNDIHNQPRDYYHDYSFSAERRTFHGRSNTYCVYSYDRLIAYRYPLESTWYVDVNTRGISQTTNHHLSVLFDSIRESFDNDYLMLEIVEG